MKPDYETYRKKVWNYIEVEYYASLKAFNKKICVYALQTIDLVNNDPIGSMNIIFRQKIETLITDCFYKNQTVCYCAGGVCLVMKELTGEKDDDFQG